MWGSYPASLRNVGGSILLPARAWYNALLGTWGLPPPCHHMAYTKSVRPNAFVLSQNFVAFYSSSSMVPGLAHTGVSYEETWPRPVKDCNQQVLATLSGRGLNQHSSPVNVYNKMSRSNYFLLSCLSSASFLICISSYRHFLKQFLRRYWMYPNVTRCRKYNDYDNSKFFFNYFL